MESVPDDILRDIADTIYGLPSDLTRDELIKIIENENKILEESIPAGGAPVLAPMIAISSSVEKSTLKVSIPVIGPPLLPRDKPVPTKKIKLPTTHSLVERVNFVPITPSPSSDSEEIMKITPPTPLQHMIANVIEEIDLEHIEDYKLDQLKNFAQRLNISTTGRKHELIKRIKIFIQQQI